jgi:hypothetical protein
MSVAEYITLCLEASGRLQTEVAEDVGFDKPNVITMIKQGKTKLPLLKIGPMAQALRIDPVELFRITLNEYMPDTWEAIQDNIGLSGLTPSEREVIDIVRAGKLAPGPLTAAGRARFAAAAVEAPHP